MRHARLTVDLDALAANYRAFRAHAPDGVAAVVKADAYGLGMEPVAARLAAEDCTRFFVATEAEGLALRETLAGDCDIYVFSGEASAEGLVPVVNQPSQLRAGPVAFHVDTGMQRLGFAPEDVPDHPEVVLLLTHLACADTPDHPMNAVQLERFEAVAARFPGVPVSIANSAGILNGVRGIGRPGIGLYGGNPYSGRDNPMRCVATLEGQVLQVRAGAGRRERGVRGVARPRAGHDGGGRRRGLRRRRPPAAVESGRGRCPRRPAADPGSGVDGPDPGRRHRRRRRTG